MKKYVQLIRVKHWIKNVLIFLAMICAKEITMDNLKITLLGFLSFSFVSSFVYVINDIRDIEKDKKHPRKKKRPLPSGKISKKSALIIAIIMLLLGIGITVITEKTISSLSLYLLLLYLTINLLYSFGLKNKPVVDVVLLATGFVIRVYYGAVLLDIDVSNWLFLTILSASLFFGFSKRCKEYQNSKDSRAVLKKYTENYLIRFQYIFIGLTIVFYSLWAIEQVSKFVLFSIPFLVIIIMRYMLVVETSDDGDPTTILYSNIDLLILAVLYGLYMIFSLVVV